MGRSVGRWRGAGVALAVAVMAGAPVWASTPVAAAWETSAQVPSRDAGYKLGLKQLDDERYEAAIATFRAALEQPEGEPEVTWQITLGLAWAHQHLGHGAFALGYYDAFLSQLDEYQRGGGKLTRALRAKRRTAMKLMKKLRAKVSKTHGVLEVTSVPDGALVTLDGSGAGPRGMARTPYYGYALAGRHVLRLTKDGYQADQREVTVAAGQVVSVRATLAETPPPALEPVRRPPPPAEPAAPASPPPAPSSSLAWAGWTTLGVGVAAVATGATFLVLARGDAADADGLDANDASYQHNFDRLSARSADRATVGWIFTGVGAAAVAGGLVWALVEGAAEDPAAAATPTPQPALALCPTRGGLAAGVTLSF